VFVIKLLQKSSGFYVHGPGPRGQDCLHLRRRRPARPATTHRPPWYKQAVAAGKPVLTKPYTDVATKKPMLVSFTAPVMQNGQRVGVVAAAMFLDGVSGRGALIRDPGQLCLPGGP
jgi:methyl-accepting chemotaxis protein